MLNEKLKNNEEYEYDWYVPVFRKIYKKLLRDLKKNKIDINQFGLILWGLISRDYERREVS